MWIKLIYFRVAAVFTLTAAAIFVLNFSQLGLSELFSECVSPTADDSACSHNGSIDPALFSFVHVMKTGGISLDFFFKCIAESTQCFTLVKTEGMEPLPGTYGRPSCFLYSDNIPVLLTSHGAYPYNRCSDDEMKDEGDCIILAGINYHPSLKTSYITVLREPVSRVFSAYRYLSRWYKPFQTHKLHEVLETPELWQAEDYSWRLRELFNTYIRMFTDDMYDYRHQYSESESADFLQLAMSNLEQLDAVYFIEHLPHLPCLLHYEWPTIIPEPTSGGCSVGHANPTEHIALTTHLDEKTRAAVAASNVLDISFYAQARLLYFDDVEDFVRQTCK